jgi:hypothetical protein
MSRKRFGTMELGAAVAFALWTASNVGAATSWSVKVLANGGAVNATMPDSIAVAEDSVWVSYTNGADSTGAGGSSTVVQYSLGGRVLQQFSITGSVDGLKIDPRTGLVWAMQNQDGNSTLTLIDPDQGITPDSPIPYTVTSASNGYDDVVFRGNRIFLSYTNPTVNSDPTIQMLIKSSNKGVNVTPILTMGATGTNLATGQRDQATAQNDPDSLKVTPSGDLQLSSGDDGQLIFVANPGTNEQAVSFLTLLDPMGARVSGLDDAVFATAGRGVFYLADTNNNRVLAITADNLERGSLFASVGSLKAFVSVDLETGIVSPIVSVRGLNGPHGLVFQPVLEGDEQGDR